MWVVGVSGGVDSSVAALLMQRADPSMKLCGVFMKNWEGDGPECRAEDDRMDALKVCAKLDIPFKSMNFSDVYYKEVFETFLEDYARGVTPNPDILCNREVKFKSFLDAAIDMGAEGIATGHYARRTDRGSEALLLRGVDRSKDQSYFLHAISQGALKRAQFPVGELPKVEVRRIAEDAGLITANKKDSTGICFIGERNFKEFLSTYLPSKKGEIVTVDGKVVGEHDGSMFVTIGQRLNVGGVKGFPGLPWFVLSKDVVTNRVVAVQGRENPLLMANSFELEEVSWISGSAPGAVFYGEIQIRHLGEAYPARFEVLDSGRVSVLLNKPIYSVAPGQAGVIYQGDVCLGGSPIVNGTVGTVTPSKMRY